MVLWVIGLIEFLEFLGFLELFGFPWFFVSFFVAE